MEQAPYKIIFVDIDWTILNHGIGDFDQKSIAAIKKAQSNGVLVYLATARPYHSLLNTGVLNQFTPDGILSANGAVGFVEDKVIFSYSFPNDVVRKLVDICTENHIVCELADERTRFMNIATNEYVDKYFGVYAAEVYVPIKDYENENISAFLVIAPEKYDEMLKEKADKNLSFFRFTEFGVDVQYYQINKGVGVKRMLEYLNIPKECAIAIGDDYGDIDMFKVVGTSIAMGNGKEEVKQAASIVTEHINDHGVEKALERLKII